MHLYFWDKKNECSDVFIFLQQLTSSEESWFNLDLWPFSESSFIFTASDERCMCFIRCSRVSDEVSDAHGAGPPTSGPRGASGPLSGYTLQQDDTNAEQRVNALHLFLSKHQIRPSLAWLLLFSEHIEGPAVNKQFNTQPKDNVSETVENLNFN